MKANLIMHPSANETKKILIDVAKKSFDLDFNARFNPNHSTLYYGKSDGWEFDKDEFLQFIGDIIPNLIINETEEVDNDATVVIKNPTRILLLKDAIDLGETMYRYIENKTEWRVNYSFGKVNSILNKNIGKKVFGKRDNCDWTRETNRKVRKYLIDITKKIADRIKEYEKITHFGLDIIRDDTTNTFYLLELNRAEGRNEENCFFLLKGFIEACSNTTKTKAKEWWENLEDEMKMGFIIKLYEKHEGCMDDECEEHDEDEYSGED